MQKTTVLFLSAMLSAPVALCIIDFRVAIKLVDCTLVMLSINHKESHLTVGTYLMLLYLILYLPTTILALEIAGLRNKVSRYFRASIYATLTLCSALSIYMFINGYSIINLMQHSN